MKAPEWAVKIVNTVSHLLPNVLQECVAKQPETALLSGWIISHDNALSGPIPSRQRTKHVWAAMSPRETIQLIVARCPASARIQRPSRASDIVLVLGSKTGQIFCGELGRDFGIHLSAKLPNVTLAAEALTHVLDKVWRTLAIDLLDISAKQNRPLSELCSYMIVCDPSDPTKILRWEDFFDGKEVQIQTGVDSREEYAKKLDRRYSELAKELRTFPRESAPVVCMGFNTSVIFGITNEMLIEATTIVKTKGGWS